MQDESRDLTDAMRSLAERPRLVRPRKGSLGFGAVYALWATLVGGFIATLATGEGYGMLPLYVGIGGFVGGAGAWRLLVAPIVAPRAIRGAVAGVLAAPVGIAVAILVMLLDLSVQHWLPGGGPEAPMSLIEALAAAAGGGLALSLLLGWFILPVGALIGFVCAR